MSSTEMETAAPEEPVAPPEPDSLLSGLQDQAENRDEPGEDLDTIPHRLEDDQGEKAEEGEALERPTFLPEKFWSDDDGVDLEKFSKSYEALEKKFHAGEHKIPDREQVGPAVPGPPGRFRRADREHCGGGL